MGRVLVIWEMGGGLGHLMRIRPIARQLADRGHDVTVGSRAWAGDHAERWFSGMTCLTTPPTTTPDGERVTFHSMPSILKAVGWADTDELAGQVDRWRAFLAEQRPDVIVLDYAPTALLAGQSLGVPIVTMSTGFTCPPDLDPMPAFGLVDDDAIKQACRDDERAVLAAVNHVLERAGQRALKHLSELFARVTRNFMTTWPELDHYGARPNAEYIGNWPGTAGRRENWPQGTGPRLVGYLQPFKNRGAIIEMLNRSKMPCLIYMGGADPEKIAKVAKANVKATAEPFDLPAASKQAELAIIHAGQGSTTGMLLAGLPMLLLPRHAEQYMIARRVVEYGAGLMASPQSMPQITQALQQLLVDPKYEQAAQRFAAEHADFDPDETIRFVSESIHQLM